MMTRRPPDELVRLETLRRLEVLDTPSEPVFDMLATMASRICGTPIALLAFIDSDRDWFKARVGTEIAELPRDVSICTYTILGEKPFIVPDALEDERFRENPIVTGDPRLRFYAGVPIRLGAGSAVGTICVVDTQPRTLTAEQTAGLEDLAVLAAAQLESRLPGPESALLHQATALNAELSALLEVTDSAVSTLDLDRLIAVLLERLVRVMRADAGAILLQEGDRLVVRASAGFDQTRGAPPSLPSDAGTGGYILATGAPLYIADTRTDSRVIGTFLQDQGIVSLLGVPLRSRDRTVGVLHVDWRTSHPETPSDLRLLETAAERCAAAIVNAQLYQQLSTTSAEAERAKERLTLALSAADLGVWDWDVASGAVFWDETNERIFGMEPGSYDGSLETFSRLVHPDDIADVRNAIDAALKGANYAPSFRIICPDGTTRWLRAYGSFQRSADGAPLRLLGVTEDITDERERQHELQRLLAREHEARDVAERAEQRIVSILERVTDAFVAHDTNWCYTYVSRKAAQIFGRTPDQMVGKHIWTEFPEGVGQPFYHAYYRAAEKQTPISFEEYYPPYDRWFENRIYPAPDGLSIFFSDVTDRRKTDERLRATNEQLRALSARMQTVREEEAVRIAREIHDELGQLLTALRMDVGWIRARVLGLEGTNTAPIVSRADAMAELTERTIRTVQRISEELRPSALDQLGLEAAIAAQLSELEHRAGVKTSMAGTLGDERLGDAIETGVFRIVQELLTNIARHAGATSVRIELELHGAPDAELEVRVIDDGRGIRSAEVAAPRSLGLVGIRERALLLGGTADLRGTEGVGTVACIKIPLGEKRE